MRVVLLVSCLLATAALADVGPRPPPCSVPGECVTCTRNGSETSTPCGDAAVDAGLVRSACTDRQGAVFSEYYCPADKPATRLCGCSSTEALGAVALLALLRRRRSAS